MRRSSDYHYIWSSLAPARAGGLLWVRLQPPDRMRARTFSSAPGIHHFRAHAWRSGSDALVTLRTMDEYAPHTTRADTESASDGRLRVKSGWRQARVALDNLTAA